MIETENKIRTQKLADTLKRCGMASSTHDANRIAEEITTTEKKVQKHFDLKRKELKEEMVKRVHGTKKEQSEEEMREHEQSNFNQMVERANDPKPVKIQTYFETPKNSQTEAEQEKNSEQHKESDYVNKIANDNVDTIQQQPINVEEPKKEVIEEQKDVLSSNKPLNDMMEKTDNEDYVNKYTEGKEQMSPAAEKEEKIEEKQQEEKMSIAEEKEEINILENKTVEQQPKQTEDHQKIDIHEYFNHANKDLSPSKRLEQQRKPETIEKKNNQQPQKTIFETVPKKEAHPKTGNNEQIDIHEYFNFAKRGML